MGEDFDRSLDDIIKLRNIRSNAGGVKGVKSGGGGGGGGMKSASMASRLSSNVPQQLTQTKPRMKVVDARNKLLMKQRVKMKDAREKLNQKARMTDAREKLNRLGMYKGANATLQQLKVQKPTVLPRFKLSNPAAIRLTRTVNNLSTNRLRQNAREKSAILANSGLRQGEQKKVFLTGSGLTVNTLNRPVAMAVPSSANLFARTVNSLTRDAGFQSGLSQDIRNPVYQRKRKLIEEDDDDMDFESTLDTKRLKFPEESVSMQRHKGTLASKISPGLQSRLGDADAGLPQPQGATLRVSNLHAIVTQQDLVELFGDVGPLRRAQFVAPGVAEVVFVGRADAQKAVENYHNRELDGQPMACKLVNPTRLAGSLRAPSNPGSSSGIKVGTLRSDHVGNEARVKSRVAPDLGVIHKALFHKASAQARRASIVVTM